MQTLNIFETLPGYAFIINFVELHDIVLKWKKKHDHACNIHIIIISICMTCGTLSVMTDYHIYIISYVLFVYNISIIVCRQCNFVYVLH